MSDTEKRKLSQARVADLRVELEKRGLDKNGVKAVLVERLVSVRNIATFPTVWLPNCIKIHAPFVACRLLNLRSSLNNFQFIF
jgi:hypothetical protein